MEDKYFYQDKAGKWFFFDETWAELHGPFQTREEAEHALKKYVDFLNSPPKESNGESSLPEKAKSLYASSKTIPQGGIVTQRGSGTTI